jgi:hypothetical protein
MVTQLSKCQLNLGHMSKTLRNQRKKLFVRVHFLSITGRSLIFAAANTDSEFNFSKNNGRTIYTTYMHNTART